MFNLFKKLSGRDFRTIAFDGPERVGKSTQIRMLKSYLEKKRKKVLVLHSSLLAGRDVTKFRVPREVKNFAYLAALWHAVMKSEKFLKGNPKNGIVIFDRLLLTHLAFCSRYSWPRPYELINTAFVRLCGFHLYKFCTILLDGYRYDKSKIDHTLDYTFERYANYTTFKVFGVENGNRPKKDIHEDIKKVLGV